MQGRYAAVTRGFGNFVLWGWGGSGCIRENPKKVVETKDQRYNPTLEAEGVEQGRTAKRRERVRVEKSDRIKIESNLHLETPN